ncbi:unnamed protein product [Clavelina lepadiformis]|uniref:MGAT4 conserved region domain-containing protein n=1 Tax=Clavelina lepadiformis TaxID=159417 RepID=A0ABP0GBP7_CLALP
MLASHHYRSIRKCLKISSVTKFKVVLALACLVLSLGAIVINTNIMLSVRNSVSPEKLHKSLQNEMQHMVKHIQLLSSKTNEEKELLEVYHKPRMRLQNGRSITTKINVQQSKDDDNDTVPFFFQKNFTPLFVLGVGRTEKVSISIGIPSVKRAGVTYLYKTLQSIFRNMYPISEDDVSVVVFLAETDTKFVKSESSKIYSEFTREVDCGLLQIISPPKNFYPSFERLPQTLGDPTNRLQWRSKEVVDAAFLMFYCHNKAQYYLMLEDDVTAAKGFITGMKEFAEQNSDKDFAYLSFSGFNSIGKLFRSKDVPVWVTFFLSFYGKKPIDWLMIDFVHMKACHPELTADQCRQATQNVKPHSDRGYFQHIGKSSSLTGKHQELVDSSFSDRQVANNPHENPAAKIIATMKAKEGSNVDDWYDDSGGLNQHFQSRSLNVGDNIVIVFDRPQLLLKILVKTGTATEEMRLKEGSAVIEVTQAVSMTDRDKTKIQYQICATFDSKGTAQCLLNHTISMIRIRMLKTSSSVWFDTVFVQ